MPFLGSALGLTAMCSLGWGNLVAFDWNDFPVGREFDCKFLKKVKSPPYALPSPRRHYIDRCISQKKGNSLLGDKVTKCAQTEARRAEKFFWRLLPPQRPLPPPFSQGLDPALPMT